MTENPFPEPNLNPINERFWRELKNHRLMLQQCTTCGETQYPPQVRCLNCFSTLEWREMAGVGTVYSYGLVHHPNNPDHFSETPFILGLVELEEGARMVTNIVESEPGKIDVGDEVEVKFSDVTDEITVPLFVPKDR